MKIEKKRKEKKKKKGGVIRVKPMRYKTLMKSSRANVISILCIKKLEKKSFHDKWIRFFLSIMSYVCKNAVSANIKHSTYFH